MPELPLLNLNLTLRTKSPYGLSVTRNSFFFRSPLVLPTISPSSTVNNSLSSGVTQPVRSLPLNRGLNPESSSAAGADGGSSVKNSSGGEHRQSRSTDRVIEVGLLVGCRSRFGVSVAARGDARPVATAARLWP